MRPVCECRLSLPLSSRIMQLLDEGANSGRKRKRDVDRARGLRLRLGRISAVGDQD